jgi:hypothetical protein
MQTLPYLLMRAYVEHKVAKQSRLNEVSHNTNDTASFRCLGAIHFNFLIMV